VNFFAFTFWMLLIDVFSFNFKQFNVKFDSIGLIVCALTDSIGIIDKFFLDSFFS
jgi:uncharacterized protein involved in cysteine biosynthesis